MNGMEVMIISNFDEFEKCEGATLIENSRNLWFSLNGIKAMFLAYENAYFVLINKNMLCGFRKRSNEILECLINIEPIFGLENDKNINWQQVFNLLLQATGAKIIYFPLVYKTSIFYTRFCSILQNYKRLYTSICKFDMLNGTNQKKISSFLHKNNINKIEKLFEIKRYCGQSVIDKLSEIEINSWKHIVNQDLVTKKEDLIFYDEMVKSGMAICSMVEDKQSCYPIAYRLDYVVGDKLVQLKTSYNENYRSVKPGTYLLLYDLFKMPGVEIADLYGGPNTIKDAIETNKIDRFDFMFGQKDLIENIAKNRINWDNKNLDVFNKRKGLRNVYAKFNK